MSRNESQIKAYKYFIWAERTNFGFTIEEINNATGWKGDTFTTYLPKRWKHYISRMTDGKFYVNGISKLSLDDFLSLQSQVKNISEIDINTQKLLDSFSEDRKELIVDLLHKVKDENLSADELIKLSNSFIGTGFQNNTIIWEIPDELKTGFQQYLNFFSDFVKKLTGQEILFEIIKVATGLKLTVESATLPIIEIDSLLIKYVNYFAKENENLISNEELRNLNQIQFFEYKQLIRDLEYEKQNLFRKIQDLYDKQNFLMQTITNLNLRISFFENHSNQLLQLTQRTENNARTIIFSPITIKGDVDNSVLGNIQTTDFLHTKKSE
jgi:hypothetical protein